MKTTNFNITTIIVPTTTMTTITTATGTLFPDVDMSDSSDGWCEYDENTNESVSIMNLEYKIIRG